MQDNTVELKEETGQLRLNLREEPPSRQRGLPKQWFPDPTSQHEESRRPVPEGSDAAVKSSDEGQDAAEGDSDDDSILAEAPKEVDPEAAVKGLLAEYTTFFEQGGSPNRSWTYT